MSRNPTLTIDTAIAALDSLPDQLGSIGNDTDLLDSIGRITSSLHNLRALVDGSAAPSTPSPGLAALRRKIARAADTRDRQLCRF